jgi:hypothetical protein
MDEAISAVEALVRVIAEDPGATLDTGLKRIESRKLLPSLHPSLIKAWGNIYGYTSDTVRHASKDARPKQEEARYLLVTCAAFVSYLIALDDGRSIHVGRSHGP